MDANADVLEVIAEYACATVQDACAFRAANKGYRRAVDTTVRRSVYEDQPAVRMDHAAALRIHRDTANLDAVRIAFTCDAFKKIARLVVVAFALDGAKDEAHEALECGARPVANSDAPMPSEPGAPLLAESFECSWLPPTAGSRSATTTPPHVRQCVTTAVLPLDAVSEGCCRAVCEGRTWGRWLSHLSLAGKTPAVSAEGAARINRVLHVIGPQLTHLFLPIASEELCPGLARCSALTRVAIVAATGGASRRRRPPRAPNPVASGPLADALIASGAPLIAVDVADLAKADALRLLAAVPTVTDAMMFKVGRADLPPAAAGRMAAFNMSWLEGNRLLPKAAAICAGADDDEWRPSEHATSLSVVARDGAAGGGAAAPLRVADLATAYPRLRELSFPAVAEGICVGDVRFPPTLTTLHLRTEDAVSNALVRHAAGAAAASGLANLTSLHIGQTFGPVDITPLVAPLAGSLRTLSMLAVDEMTDAEAAEAAAAISGEGGPGLVRLEAALSRLVALVKVHIPTLPTARCFLGGDHTWLRELEIGCIDSPAAPFAAVARACPRLVTATSASGDELPLPPPPGWCAPYNVHLGPGAAPMQGARRRISFVVA